MITGKKGIAYKFHYIFLVLIFISLDSTFNLPYAHLLRWVYPIILIAFISKEMGEIAYPKGALWPAVAAMFLIASVYSINIKYSFGRVISYLIMTCFFYMFYKRQRYNNTLINIPWYLGKIFILYEIANFFTTVTGDLVRGTGITGNANSLGLWSNVAFVFSVYYFKIAKSFKIKSLYSVIAIM